MPVCDIVVPVHGQPQWAALCISELLQNTPREALGQVLLVDDASDLATRATLESLAARNASVRVLSQQTRGGFAKTVNLGLADITAPYVLLLNTDCLLTPGAIPKLIAHCESDPSVGLVSPFSNNSPPLTLAMPEGCNYHGVNAALERALRGVHVDACTVVANALLLTRECLNRTGLFDETYGPGYGEDTDYQFRAMQNGFRAVAALDTYVYHKGAESFGADDPHAAGAKPGAAGSSSRGGAPNTTRSPNAPRPTPRAGASSRAYAPAISPRRRRTCSSCCRASTRRSAAATS